MDVLDMSDEDDRLLGAAKDAIRRRGRASAVVLQRELAIGYQRAIRLLDAMTAAGDLGRDTPSGAREIKFK